MNLVLLKPLNFFVHIPMLKFEKLRHKKKTKMFTMLSFKQDLKLLSLNALAEIL